MMIVRLRLTSEEEAEEEEKEEEEKERKKNEKIDSDCHTVVLTTDQLQYDRQKKDIYPH